MIKKILRFVLLFLLIAVPMIATAQELAVAEFSLDENDLTANLNGTTKYDQNGEKCALIKIFTTATGFTFDVGSLGVADMVQKPGEIWLYVPSGIRRITINHPQLGMCDYAFTVPITKARTYRMKLVAGQVQTIIKKAVTSQYVIFNVNPPKATVEINNQFVDVVDGAASVRLPFGSYDYTVRAPQYNSMVGKVQVNDPKKKHIVDIKLTPAFSTVTMSVDADAEIWINDQKRGVRTFTGELGYGTYLVECRQEGHRTSQKEVTLTKESAGQTITLPVPTPIYGSIDVNSSPIGCDIYVDNVKVGETPMLIEKCLTGTHTLRIVKQGYSEFVRTITVSENQTETLMARMENGREVSIIATPGAAIYIDGNNVGKGQYKGNLTFGEHIAYAVLGDKRSAEKTVSVPQGNGAIAEVRLMINDVQTFTVDGVTFEMVPVEEGTFVMGATAEQGGEAEDDEKPRRNVTLSSFYIGKTEVTQALWEAVMGNNPSRFRGANLPVEKVTWKECQRFIMKLNKKTGKKFRLPTEAEWEYAARGGNKSKGYKYSGSNNIDDISWFIDNDGSSTHNVATRQPNELGIYDMTGNVWEWCQDLYGAYGDSSLSNPTGATSGDYYVYRGGSWYSYESNCRVSYRSRNTPDYWSDKLGLRLVLPQ